MFRLHARGEQLLSALCYAATSVLILLVNKVVLSAPYHFKFPVLMTLFHMTVCVIILSALRRGKVLSYTGFDWQLAKKAFPLSLCFVANIVVGMLALRATNIPMFATLRRLTVLFVLTNEWAMLGKRPAVTVCVAVSIMIMGSLIGGWGDLHFDPLGYFFVLLNNCITALNLVLMKKTISDTKLAGDQMGIMYYNSLLAIPPLVLIACLNGEVFGENSVRHYHLLGNVSFQLMFGLSALTSFFMNYSTFWCTRVNSALTTSVTGQVKNVLSSFVSILFFDRESTPALLTGLTVGLSGSMLYGYHQYQTQKSNKLKAEKTQSLEEGQTTKMLDNGSSSNGSNGSQSLTSSASELLNSTLSALMSTSTPSMTTGGVNGFEANHAAHRA